MKSFKERHGYHCYVGTMLWGEVLHRGLHNRAVSLVCALALMSVAVWWLHDVKVLKEWRL